MDYIIEDLGKVNPYQNKIWGNKAAYLADARQLGLPVLDGFCISMNKGGDNCFDHYFRENVEIHFKNLKKRTGAQRFIVRSSAQCEDNEHHIFPGIYRSKGNVTNLTELMDAVEVCFRSFQAEIAELYTRCLDMAEADQEYFCILIQEQISPEYSGVLFTEIPLPGCDKKNSYYVELVNGHCHNMLQGMKKGNTYMLESGGNNLQVTKMSGHLIIDIEIISKVLSQLGKVINDKMIVRYGRSLDVEWGYYQNKIVIFQIRSIPFQVEVHSHEMTQSENIGLKAKAMKKFHELGLFQKELLIIEPGKELCEIEQYIKATEGLKGPVTVRYSCSQKLGLPRYFAADKWEAYQFIQSTYNPNWSIILHESISVTDSYELCLDKEKSILEHVPGMWESDSKIFTDLWIYYGKQVTAFATNSVRNAKFEDVSGIKYTNVEPYSKSDIKKIAETFFPYIQILRQNWTIKSGTNFHFVKDCEDRIFFLNHRELSKSPEWNTSGEKLIVIESAEDFSNWKGESILLKLNMKRGEEMMLKKYVPFLRSVGAKVYVQFGILSHPAILLREMGIQVYPEYVLHSKYIFAIQE